MRLSPTVTLAGDNKISGDHQLAITISAPKGSFTGSFVDPASSAKRTVKGVILRGQNIGGGQFPHSSDGPRVHRGPVMSYFGKTIVRSNFWT